MVIRHLGVEEMDAAAPGRLGKLKGEDGIKVVLLAMGRSPGLDNQAAGNNREITPANLAVEGGESAADLPAEFRSALGRRRNAKFDGLE